MLVLSRRADESILLPTIPAVIKVISAQAGLVRLGIEAPSHIPIVREELCRGLTPAAPSNPVVGNRIDHLIAGLTRLRVQLDDGDPSAGRTLVSLEAELQALRNHLDGCPVDVHLTAAPRQLANRR